MFSHKNSNSSDSVNTWRNVSLKIALIAFWTQEDPKISFKCFLSALDPLLFRHNCDSCDATANATLTRTMSLCKLKYGEVRQNLT